MTNKEERPAGCVLRLFGVPEQTVQKAVETLPDTWQGHGTLSHPWCGNAGGTAKRHPAAAAPGGTTVADKPCPGAVRGRGADSCRCRSASAGTAPQAFGVQRCRRRGAAGDPAGKPSRRGKGVRFWCYELRQCGAYRRLSRKLRKAPQAEPARTLARVQAMQKLTGAALAVGCVELPQSRLLLVGGKKGCWLRCVSPDENPGLWLLDLLRRAACGLPQAGGTCWQFYGRAVPDTALTPAVLAAAPPAPPNPKHHRLGKALVVLLLLALAALAAGWYYTGGDLAALPQKLQSLGTESLPHAGARLV